MVGASEDAQAKQPAVQLNHANGVCVTGVFESSGAAASLSKAAVFAAGSVPVIGRISLAGGTPLQTEKPATVRALALRFMPRSGEEWRMGTVNIPVFVVNSDQGFYDQVLAAAPDPATGKPDPEKLRAFLELHPETVNAMAIISNTPVSSGFADATYFGVEAYRFVNASGAAVPVRWSLVPAQSFVPESAAQAAAADKNYLFDAFIAAVNAHPLRWRLMVTIGQPGDPTNDVTLPWPSERRQVDVGTVSIDHVSTEASGPCTDFDYDPALLPSGIAPADDAPLLTAAK